jgi:hypothetical protein
VATPRWQEVPRFSKFRRAGRRNPVPKTGPGMSEYQYYEFQAIDRPLDRAAQDAVRSVSSRARITATSFTNEYNWGDFEVTRASSWSAGSTSTSTSRIGARGG